MTEERKYWDAEVETMPIDKLRKVQEKNLQEIVARAYEKTALHRRKFDAAGVKPQDINTLDDLEKLPLSEYLEDFCQTPMPEKMTVPMDEVKIVSSTSGTVSGFTQPFPMTQKEWEALKDFEARFRWSIGVRPNDIAFVLTGFDCCPEGYKRLGATFLLGHCGRRNMDHQIRLIDVMGVTVLEHLPSLVLMYFGRAKELGIDIKKTKLRLVSGVGEGWAETYKKKVEAEYGFPFRTGYGSVEGGGVAAECEVGKGMHVLSDCCIFEVIDPETKKVLGPGEEGELVCTSFVNQTIPAIRYRMGDVAKILPYEPCPCGRTHPKISMVRGRVGQIMKIKDKKILPIDVEEVVASTPGLGEEYQIIVTKPGEMDRLEVKAEYRPEVEDVTVLTNRFEEAIFNQLGVESKAKLVPQGTLTRAIFKAQRIITAQDG
jgi:phenylacetate-CoA ligase